MVAEGGLGPVEPAAAAAYAWRDRWGGPGGAALPTESDARLYDRPAPALKARPRAQSTDTPHTNLQLVDQRRAPHLLILLRHLHGLLRLCFGGRHRGLWLSTKNGLKAARTNLPAISSLIWWFEKGAKTLPFRELALERLAGRKCGGRGKRFRSRACAHWAVCGCRSEEAALCRKRPTCLLLDFGAADKALIL